MRLLHIVLCVALGLQLITAKSVEDKATEQKHEPPTPTSGLEMFRQDWGYVKVRPQANMFWWLYYSTHTDGYTNKPLVMWLNGGPGASSTGYGNFEIIGPQDPDLKLRNASWLREANLFVDNPVGAGFSYVEDDSAYTTDVEEIAMDLVSLLKQFLIKNPEFKKTPFYVFGQSYGGKMAAQFAKRLHQSVQAGEMECNIGGFAMGNSWVSPLDSTLACGGKLYWMGIVDELGLEAIDNAALACRKAADAGNWWLSTQLWRATQQVVFQKSNYVDFYNILNYVNTGRRDQMLEQLSHNDTWFEHLINPSPHVDKLSNLMNGEVRKHLGIIPENVTWQKSSSKVFAKQEGDFMKANYDVVSELLDKTDMSVIIYQGALDLICDTKGAMDWVQRMTWKDLEKYNNAKRTPLLDPVTRQTETFVKAYKNFKFYWNNLAGHSVPGDRIEPSLRMLLRIFNNDDY